MMTVLPQTEIHLDSARGRMTIGFGYHRLGILLVLPWLVLGVSGYCYLMSVMPHTSSFDRWWAPLGHLVMGMGILLIFLRNFARDDVCIDQKRKGIYGIISFRGFSRELSFKPFEGILGLGFQGEKISGRYGTYWAYRLVAVWQDGTMYELSHAFRRQHFKEKEGEAEKIGQFIGCSFCIPQIQDSVLFVEGEGSKKKISYRKG
ncbi:MAG: hypothetical protein HQM10_25115 [Candidatus Riflebacteria bacterium]|nr:hypothetical protein [Candidatus Riflebacteria bacterium]